MSRKPLFEPLTGIRAANSNTRISLPGQPQRPARPSATIQTGSPDNLGLTSARLRERMVERLRERGIENETVLTAMATVARHLFVDEALASRAYEDVALPIGHRQTISQPWVVAHMLSLLYRPQQANKVLEVGAGCGYQAAVLAQLYRDVYAIERVRALYDTTKERLAAMDAGRIHLLYGDGMLGWKAHAPYDAIVVAAAGAEIPQALLDQLAIGGRLVAPQGEKDQHLMLIVREEPQRWSRKQLEAVRFVPLRPGTQT